MFKNIIRKAKSIVANVKNRVMSKMRAILNNRKVRAVVDIATSIATLYVVTFVITTIVTLIFALIEVGINAIIKR